MTRRDALDPDVFATVVRHAPLVSIDLVVRAADDRVLLGLRTNRPAQGSWFVPGGRIRKDELLAAAFRRITRDELGVEIPREQARVLGAFDHLYDDNFAGASGWGTHYVALGHELRADLDLDALPQDQHRSYRWCTVEEALADDAVHEHTKRYLR